MWPASSIVKGIPSALCGAVNTLSISASHDWQLFGLTRTSERVIVMFRFSCYSPATIS